MTDIEAERPAGFDLSREWDRVVEEVERRRSSVSATVLIAAHLVPVLRAQFGRHCDALDALDALDELGDGRARVRVAAPMALSIAETLAGWGAAVEVLEPPSVQDELARIGAELVQRYEHG